MATDFADIVKQAEFLGKRLTESQKAGDALEKALSGAAATVTEFTVMQNVMARMVESSSVLSSSWNLIKNSSKSQAELLKRQVDLTASKNFFEKELLTATGAQAKLAQELYDSAEHELGVLRLQRQVNAELNKLGSVRLTMLKAYIDAGKLLWSNERKLNEQLIEANSSHAQRTKLLESSLMLQVQTGLSYDKITEAARALVSYNMDTADSFGENLKLVAQLNTGVGVSVNESAHLAAVVERQVNGSFKDVAETVSQLVDDTALAGDEAAKLAANLGTAMSRLRPGIASAGIAEVTRIVGKYEGALKEIGGQSGAFQQLITSLTTPEGLAGAGALGVSPEFLATSNGVQDVMNRFARYGDMLVGQSQGWERQMRLQALAQMFGVSADQANQMLIAIKRANDEQIGQISTQERWRNQMSATNQGITRLGNSLAALLQGSMYPLVRFVGWAANGLADWINKIAEYKDVVYGAGIVLMGGAVLLTIRLASLAKSLYQAAIASAVYQNTLGKAGIPGLGGGSIKSILMTLGTSVVTFGKDIKTWVSSASNLNSLRNLPNMLRIALMNFQLTGVRGIWSVLSGTFRTAAPRLAMGIGADLALGAAPLVFAGIMLKKIYDVNKQSLEDQRAANKVIINREKMLEDQTRRRIYSAARAGDASEVERLYVKLAQQANAKFSDLKDPRARKQAQENWLNEQMQGVKRDVEVGMATKLMFTPMAERTPEQKRESTDMLKANEKLVKINEAQEKVLTRTYNSSVERMEEERIERAKMGVWATSVDYWSRLGGDE
jgi:hypothetical protein